jgi:hypothetical protein
MTRNTIQQLARRSVNLVAYCVVPSTLGCTRHLLVDLVQALVFELASCWLNELI